ncbi:MAG TPA: transglycosylase domain-containing protein [Gaiellaceae bacterium]|nr:transglycosylase domain-containing protein [Gaiellaceae bacterium]
MRDRNRADLELAAILLARRSRLRRVHTKRKVAVAATAAVVVLTVVLVGTAATGRAVLLGSCNLNALQPVALGQNSFVYADNGTLLGVVPSSVNREPLRLDQISPYLRNATVAIEDRRFWQHGALDYQGIVRALYSDVTAGRIVQGGSTITQELVRNLYIGNASRTFSRKVKEACLAIKLAQMWPKSRILNSYLNEVFYGRAAHGAQAAAETFFSTRAQDLSLAQAAMLAGLPQAPTVYDPMRHPAMAMQRRDEVLRAMLVSRVITNDEFARAVSAPLGLKPGNLYQRQAHENFFGWAEQQLVQRFGARRVAAGGLRVRTTLDPLMQQQAQSSVRSVMQHPSDPAAALVAIDPRTGAVRAMVGYVPDGRRMKFNLATQSTRTAGSSFKPFVLATAIEHGISLYSSFSGPPSLTIPDRSCYGPQGPWDVHNYADESAGYMNLLSATANSVNTIFAQLVAKVGPWNVVPVAHKMGITTKLQPVCSITLGTQPVNPLEMTDGYATLAAHGIHHAPQAFELVRAPDGKVLGRLNASGAQAISRSTADQVTYALEGVIQHGTGTAAYFGRPAAGKTGTAENFQDAWFCGYVPQLAACVWVGYPKAEISLYDVEGVGSVFGGSLPAEIWRRFMSAATARMPALGFPTPQITGTTMYGTSYYVPTTPAAPTQTIINVPPGPVPPPPKGGGQ